MTEEGERRTMFGGADSEHLLQEMLARSPAIFWTLDGDLRFTTSRGGGLALLGLEQGQAVGMSLFEYFGTNDSDFLPIARHIAALRGSSERFEQSWAGKVYETRLEPLKGESGEIVGVAGLAIDVTEARRSSLVARSLLRVSEEARRAHDLPAFFAALHAIVGDLMYARNFYLALVDHSRGTLSFPYFVDENDAPPSPRPLGRGLTEYVLRTGQPLLAPREVDQELVAAGEVDEVGSPAVDWLGVPLTSGGMSFGVVAVQSYRDDIRFGERDLEVLTFVAQHISAAYERRLAEGERESSFELLRATLESTADGILVVDAEGKVVTANRQFSEMWRISPELLAARDDGALLAYVLDQLSSPESFLAKVRELYRDPDATSFDVLEFKDGRVFERYSRGAASGGSALRVWSFRDVSERRQAEQDLLASREQLLYAQKMEALGRMAGGVAHDFNNLLTVISGYAELLSSRLPSESPHQSQLAAITRASRRASELTSQLLAVGHRQPVTPRILNFGELLSGLRSWLERLTGEGIDLRIRIEPGLWNVRADPGQIEQAVLNLVANARDAMPEGGALTLAAGNRELEDTVARRQLGAEVGAFVLLEVSDQGVGMDRATVERIFEPFFTTKEKGKGTGLGLSSVYGIVRQNGGVIRVESTPGEGSTFRIYLPRAEGELPAPALESSKTVVRGGETVLLVEDDDAVRTLLSQLLREQGYSVLEARDGREALAVAAVAERFDLLLTDVVMPHLGGVETAGRLRAERPDLPVVFLSGYADTLPDTAHEPGMRLLAKPVAAAVLARTLRELLDARRG